MKKTGMSEAMVKEELDKVKTKDLFKGMKRMVMGTTSTSEDKNEGSDNGKVQSKSKS